MSGYTLLQENVDDEFRGRTFGSLTVLSRLGLFLSLTVFPTLAIAFGTHAFFLGGQRIDLSGTRLALWTAGILALAPDGSRGDSWGACGSPPEAARAGAEAEATAGDGPLHRVRGRRGRGQGHADRSSWRSLRSLGHDVLVTREPGGTDLGEHLRALLLDPKTGQRRPRSEALLFAASRAQTVTSVIRPALADGQDRDLRPLRRLLARLPGMGARPRRAGRADAERLGDAGPLPRPGDPAARRARARAAALDGGARPDGARGRRLPREGVRRLPEDRRGASGAVRRDRRGRGPAREVHERSSGQGAADTRCCAIARRDGEAHRR